MDSVRLLAVKTNEERQFASAKNIMCKIDRILFGFAKIPCPAFSGIAGMIGLRQPATSWPASP
jgi:hypothetical protein